MLIYKESQQREAFAEVPIWLALKHEVYKLLGNGNSNGKGNKTH